MGWRKRFLMGGDVLGVWIYLDDMYGFCLGFSYIVFFLDDIAMFLSFIGDIGSALNKRLVVSFRWVVVFLFCGFNRFFII